MTPGESVMAKVQQMADMASRPSPCRCWSVGEHVHQGHCCMTPGFTCHAREGQAILENGSVA